jgi:hypothetical protein
MSSAPFEGATTEILAYVAGPAPLTAHTDEARLTRQVDGVVAGLLQRGPGSPALAQHFVAGTDRRTIVPWIASTCGSSLSGRKSSLATANRVPKAAGGGRPFGRLISSPKGEQRRGLSHRLLSAEPPAPRQ